MRGESTLNIEYSPDGKKKKKPGLNYKSLSEYGFPSLNATDPGKSSTQKKKRSTYVQLGFGPNGI